MDKLETIYIYLLDEGSASWRPTKGYKLEDMVYIVLPTDNYDPEDENWEFKPGDIVACKEGTFEGEKYLAAYKLAEWNITDSGREDIIYINILEESTGGWRPTKGIRLGENAYKVLPVEYLDPADENWEFKPGDVVECKNVILPNNKTILVAYKLKESAGR